LDAAHNNSLHRSGISEEECSRLHSIGGLGGNPEATRPMIFYTPVDLLQRVVFRDRETAWQAHAYISCCFREGTADAAKT
jgi:hypothetical protein